MRPLSPAATGSGIVLDRRNRILTSNHIVKDCNRLLVRHASRVVPARIGETDPVHDLAIVIPERPVDVLPAYFRKSPPLPGETVVMAGFPKEVLKQGMMKAMKGKIVELNSSNAPPGNMRLDTAMNPGASGGAVLDRSGRVIGLISGFLANRRSGVPLRNPGLAVRGDILQEFLHRAGIDYRLGKSATRGIRSIASRAAGQLVMIQCDG